MKTELSMEELAKKKDHACFILQEYGWSLKKIGQLLGVCPERIRQRVHKERERQEAAEKRQKAKRGFEEHAQVRYRGTPQRKNKVLELRGLPRLTEES